MVRTNYGGLLLALVIVLSSSVFANDANLKEANSLFAKRGESHKNVKEAKKLYLNIVKEKKEKMDTRKLALDRFARLAVFEGHIAKEKFGVTDSDSVKIFEECIEATSQLKPKGKEDPSPEYAYWRAMCIGLWGANESNPVMFGYHLTRLDEMYSLIKQNAESQTEFDGYGWNRFRAGMYIRSKFLRLVNLYDPKASLILIDTVLANKCDNYMSYILKAEAQIELGRNDEAKETLNEGIAGLKKRTAEDSVEMLYAAENVFFLVHMEEMLAKMQ